MRLLITGAVSWDDNQKKELENLRHALLYIQDERIALQEQGINPEAIEGSICNGLFLYNDISAFKNLRYIQLTSAGYDRVPMQYVKSHQIEIRNARDVYSIPMAEFAVAGVLMLYKQSFFFFENQKSHQWKKHRNLMELNGKTVCIIGCGSVGSECAKRFRSFGCKILGIDKYPRDDEIYELMQELEQLESALRKSDVVVLTLPLTEETFHLMNRGRLAEMKPGAILINISRGGVVDTEALERVMLKLGGAVLDVFEEEPLSVDSSLWDMENVIITPHNSFVGEGNRQRLQDVIVAGLMSMSGEK